MVSCYRPPVPVAYSRAPNAVSSCCHTCAIVRSRPWSLIRAPSLGRRKVDFSLRKTLPINDPTFRPQITFTFCVRQHLLKDQNLVNIFKKNFNLIEQIASGHREFFVLRPQEIDLGTKLQFFRGEARESTRVVESYYFRR